MKALQLLFTASILLQLAVPAQGEVSPLVINPRVFGLSPTDFATTLAISGNTIAAHQHLGSGSINIFSITASNTIIKGATINAPDAVYDGANFGVSVGLSGDVIYAGCSTTWRNSPHEGTSYIFKNLSDPNLVDRWTELPGQAAGYFGWFAQVVGDVLVVSQGTNPDFGSRAGVFFYRVDTNSQRTSVFSFLAPNSDRDVRGFSLSSNRCVMVWASRTTADAVQMVVFDIQRTSSGAFSGISTNCTINFSPSYEVFNGIAGDGSFVALGDPTYFSGTNQCGAVHLWRLDSGSATLIATLLPPDLQSGGGFGHSIYLKQNTLLVGSPYTAGVSNAQGCAYVYNISSNASPKLINRLQPGAPAIGTGERFASTMVWEGNRICIGSSGGWPHASGDGAIYIYDASEVTQTTWQPYTATATSVLVSSFVVGATVNDRGYGYTNVPYVHFVGGGGSGAQAIAVVSNGVVTAINVISAGYGYTNPPVVVISPPFVPNPVLSLAPMSFLSFSNVTPSGVYQLQRAVGWYWLNDSNNFTSTGTVHTQMVAGVKSSGDYRLVLNPAPTQAFASPQTVNGFLVGAAVTNGGSGYVTTPTVTIVGGGGTNATAVAHLSGGVVASISIVSAGSGYTNTPTLRISAPPAASLSPVVQSVMKANASNLVPYDTYQIEYKTTLGEAWKAWSGGGFIPTTPTNVQHLFLTNGTGFLRLGRVP